MELLSVILAYVALAAALTAVLAMLARLGGGAGETGPALLWVHRVAGYLFFGLMAFIFAGMVYKVTSFEKGMTPGVAWHGAAGLAVMAFIFTKWAVVRPFRGLMKFAPALGIVVFCLAFVAVNLGAAAYLLDRLTPRRAAAARAAGEVAATGEEAAVVEAAAPRGKGADALHAARFVFAEKCGKCHHLRRPFENPRPPDQWTPLIKRMQSYDAGWISDADVMAIGFYLTGDYGPGS